MNRPGTEGEEVKERRGTQQVRGQLVLFEQEFIPGVDSVHAALKNVEHRERENQIAIYNNLSSSSSSFVVYLSP